MGRRWAWLLLILVILGGPAVVLADHPHGPRLTVVIVIDQFREEYLHRFAPWFGSGGFKRLAASGAVFSNARHNHATTYTGPGHASILSGSYGYRNGIVGNNWWNRQTHQREAMLYDAAAPLLGVPKLTTEDDNSPRNFSATTVGDELQLVSKASHVVALAVKDRAAVLLGGKMGPAFWFSEATGNFTTSTYYMKALPPWVVAFNNQHVPDRYYGKKWEYTLPAAAYQGMGPDDSPYESDVRGLGRTFPHPVTGGISKPGPEFYEAFTTTPWANDMELELAKAAVQAEDLGHHASPDLLAVSLTANDYIGHAFGPDSHEVMDVTVATDRQLAGFLNWLDSRFKPEDLLVVLTADHGASPIPEEMAARGVPAARIKKLELKTAITTALTARYGAGDWVLAEEDPSIYLNEDLIAQKALPAAEVEHVAGDSLMAIKGIAGYFTRSQFENGGLPPTDFGRMYARAFHKVRSGDILVVTEPFYFWGKYGEKEGGSTHGSPYSYDTHVPLMIRGAGVRPGQYDFPVDLVDLAPTLSTLLGVNYPSSCEGRPLFEVLTTH